MVQFQLRQLRLWPHARPDEDGDPTNAATINARGKLTAARLADDQDSVTVLVHAETEVGGVKAEPAVITIVL